MFVMYRQARLRFPVILSDFADPLNSLPRETFATGGLFKRTVSCARKGNKIFDFPRP